MGLRIIFHSIAKCEPNMGGCLHLTITFDLVIFLYVKNRLCDTCKQQRKNMRFHH